MVAGFIFVLHIMLLIYAFLKNKKEGIGEGFLAIMFVCIIFAVGWTLSTILTNLLFSLSWFNDWYWQPLNSWVWVRIRKEINRDTISLLLLTAGEIVFYYFYFLDDKKASKPETSSDNKENIK